MLSEKLWKADAVLRLMVSVMICIFMGTLIGLMVRFYSTAPRANEFLFPVPIASACGLFAGALWILRRPWRFEDFTRNLLGLMACIYGGFLLTWWATRLSGDMAELQGSTWKTVLAVLSFQGATLVLAHRFLREHAVEWTVGFGLWRDWRQAMLYGVLLALVALPIGWGLQSASALVMEHLHVIPQEQLPVHILRATERWSNRLVLGVAAILIAPAGEEVLFRGILYPAIKQRGYPRLAFWGTSVLFGAIHLNLAIFLPLTVLALLLTWLYEKTNNLIAPITAHSFFNALNFALLYASPWLEQHFKLVLHKSGTS
jgi:CAAX protease family protein